MSVWRVASLYDSGLEDVSGCPAVVTAEVVFVKELGVFSDVEGGIGCSLKFLLKGTMHGGCKCEAYLN